MALILVPLVGFSFLLVWMAIYGMERGNNQWLVPLVNALKHPQGSFLKRTALKIAGAGLAAASFVVRYVTHYLSIAASHGYGTVAHWINGWATWLYHASLAGAEFSQSVADSFAHLVAHTIPREVRVSTQPLWHRINANRKYILGLLLPELALGKWLYGKITHKVLPELKHLFHQATVVLPRSIAHEGLRIKDLEDRLAHPSRAWIKRIWRAGWILVGAGLMVKFLIRKFPYLFCRNVTKVAKTVCGWPNLLADLLLGEAVAAFVITDMCDLVTAIEKVADGFEPVLRVMVTGGQDFIDHCGGDLPTAADPPGYSGPWHPTGT